MLVLKPWRLMALLFLGLLVSLVLIAESALAIEPGKVPGEECEGGVCFDLPDEDQLPEEVIVDDTRSAIMTVVNYFLGFVGLAAVIALVYSAVLWITSGGNEEQFEKGKKGVLYALAGILLIILSYTIVNWVASSSGGPDRDTGPTTTNDGGGGGNNNNPNDSSGGSATNTNSGSIDIEDSIEELADLADELFNNNTINQKLEEELAEITNTDPGELTLEELIEQVEPETVKKVKEKIMEDRKDQFEEELVDIVEDLPDIEELEEVIEEIEKNVEKLADNPENVNRANELKKKINELEEKLADFPKMTASITARPASGNAPLTVTLDGLNSTDPSGATIPSNNYNWYYIDSSGSEVDLGTGPIQDLTLTEPGGYVINLRVESANQEGADSEAIAGLARVRVNVYPESTEADFTVNGEEVGSIYRTSFAEAERGLTFDPGSSTTSEGRQIEEWIWKFDDGSEESYVTPERVTHSFSKPNSMATLTVRDNTGSEFTKRLDIKIQDVVAKIEVNPREGTVDNLFIFNANRSLSTNGTIKSYYWELEATEVVQANEQRFTHQFEEPGEYLLKLLVEDHAGNKATSSQIVKVHSREPLAGFSARIIDDSNPATVRFDASRSSDEDSDRLFYSWDFDGDGKLEIEKSTESIVNYTYEETGAYPTKLIVTDQYGESDENVQTITIDSILEVDFTVSRVSAQIGQEIEFKADAPEATGFMWEFDDGERAFEENKSHSFQREGRYLVRLTVTDEQNQENSVTKWIYIAERNAPLAVIEASTGNLSYSLEENLCGSGQTGIAISRSEVINFSARNSLNQEGTSSDLNYQWDFHDGTFASDQSIRKRFTELTPRNSCIPLTLTVTDQGSGKSDSLKVYLQIKNQPPIMAKFNVAEPAGNKETPVSVSVSVSGSSDPDGTIVHYKWWAENVDNLGEKMDLHTTNTPSTKITLLSVGNTGETNRWRFFVEIKDNDGAVVSNEEVFGPSQIVEVKNGANPRPEVSFSMDKSSIKVGDTINFVADARDPKGERIPDSAFKWDFDGDNIFEDTSSGPVVSRRYELPGEYEVRLKVVFRGLTTSETQKVFVERTSKLPLAAFTYEAAGRKVDFDASNSKIDTTVAGNNLDLAWDFDTSVDTDGDGVKDNDVQATEKETSFVYAEAKTYEAKLVVEDKTGGEDQVVRGIVITPSGRVTSGGSGSGGSSRQLEAVRSLPLTSNAPITTLELITLDQIVPKNGNLDITAIIKNADGTIYSGDVRFEVLQGSAQILPQEVEAVAGRAKTTITGLGEGPLLIRATATDTFSGNLAEALNLQVQ